MAARMSISTWEHKTDNLATYLYICPSLAQLLGFSIISFARRFKLDTTVAELGTGVAEPLGPADGQLPGPAGGLLSDGPQVAEETHCSCRVHVVRVACIYSISYTVYASRLHAALAGT